MLRQKKFSKVLFTVPVLNVLKKNKKKMNVLGHSLFEREVLLTSRPLSTVPVLNVLK
jgi:hypothetical protein